LLNLCRSFELESNFDIVFDIWTACSNILTEMDKKKAIDDTEPGPAPSRAVDRFGFIKPEQSGSPDGLPKGRSIHERERYEMPYKS